MDDPGLGQSTSHCGARRAPLTHMSTSTETSNQRWEITRRHPTRNPPESGSTPNSSARSRNTRAARSFGASAIVFSCASSAASRASRLFFRSSSTLHTWLVVLPMENLMGFSDSFHLLGLIVMRRLRAASSSSCENCSSSRLSTAEGVLRSQPKPIFLTLSEVRSEAVVLATESVWALSGFVPLAATGEGARMEPKDLRKSRMDCMIPLINPPLVV
mmetsp:Transcript_39592/g.98045  ORF Transcript_39592/g.98045 Transcript_39592/m.98045 type:complete len:216 (-) Transcript_39592:400-1047(-)